MRIPIAKPIITGEEKARVLQVMESGMLVAGREVREFERQFADYLGAPHAVATSSGTTALEIALEAVGIGPGDVVATTPFTFVATSNAIVHRGAEPLFVDVDAQTYNLDPRALEEALRRRPGVRAVLVVHLFGLACDMPAIMALARRHGLLVIEDCAQALGAVVDSRQAGTFGDAAIFSFYPSKAITTGEGGMVVTGFPEVARRACMLVDAGRDGTEYDYEVIGYNYRMTNMAAAIGLVQLTHLDARNAIRRRHAEMLTRGLRDLPWVAVPVEPEGYRHVYNQYTVRVTGEREALAAHLRAREIGTKIYYPMLVPDTAAYRKRGQPPQFPVAARLVKEVLSIPVHPALAASDVEEVVQAVREFAPGLAAQGTAREPTGAAGGASRVEVREAGRSPSARRGGRRGGTA
ncbi:MAG: DegT/DnrJ/EryC1/StrS aminotransferase family protein [Armatimonadetes bacterium]|nr:DegT/DnrJ/EryC1/StrS aminotransferase family protein [Armatimonadota bacterium]